MKDRFFVAVVSCSCIVMEFLSMPACARYVLDIALTHVTLSYSKCWPFHVGIGYPLTSLSNVSYFLRCKLFPSYYDPQAGKHEAIVKNVHDLLAHLAWDFSAEQLDHLFVCFQVWFYYDCRIGGFWMSSMLVCACVRVCVCTCAHVYIHSFE